MKLHALGILELHFAATVAWIAAMKGWENLLLVVDWEMELFLAVASVDWKGPLAED